MSELSILDIKSEALLPSSARHGVPSAPYAPAAFWLGCFAASVHEGWQAELLLAASSGEGSRRAQRAAGKQKQKRIGVDVSCTICLCQLSRVHGTRVFLQMQLRTASMTYDDDAHAASAKIIWMLLRTHLSHALLLICSRNNQSTRDKHGCALLCSYLFCFYGRGMCHVDCACFVHMFSRFANMLADASAIIVTHACAMLSLAPSRCTGGAASPAPLYSFFII